MREFIYHVLFWSLRVAMHAQGLGPIYKKLLEIEPDISNQETSMAISESNDFWLFNRRALQAFQCENMLKALNMIDRKDKYTVVDIGDSAGTHMLYLSKLVESEIRGIGVNLDAKAIERIKARGQEAILSRAEDLTLDEPIDLFTSFQMVEHLHNPTLFLRRLAKKSKGDYILITVPYMKQSRVGLQYVRNEVEGKNFIAEEVHIFELSPEDWMLLMKHSGWKPVYQKIYYQYPKNIPVLSTLLRVIWKKIDYEGFWAVILQKDPTYECQYADWEE